MVMLTKILNKILVMLCFCFIAAFLLLMVSVPFLVTWEPDTIRKDNLITAVSYGLLAYGSYPYFAGCRSR